MTEGMHRTVRRDNAMDMMKGWLTILMVLSHLTYVIPFSGIERFNTYVNLTTFSGFMFCFGYVCWNAYIESDCEDVSKRLAKGASKSLFAFYICGIASYMHGTWLDWGKVLFLQSIPGMTEFLISFCLMYIMILVFRKYLRKLSLKKGIAISMISLIVTAFFPFEIIISPIMGSIVGTTTYYCFPLMAYLSYFLVGSLLAKYQIIFNKWLFIATCVSTGIFLFFCRSNGRLPGRFPPTVLWILGGSFFVYLYYCIFKLISRKGKELRTFVFMGKHSLVFLVVSNLLLFALWNDLIDKKILDMVSMNNWSYRYILYVLITFVLSISVIRIHEREKFILNYSRNICRDPNAKP